MIKVWKRCLSIVLVGIASTAYKRLGIRTDFTKLSLVWVVSFVLRLYRVELERFSAGSVDSVLDLWAQVSVDADIGA